MPRRDYDSDLDERPQPRPRRRRKAQKKQSSNSGLILAIAGFGVVFLLAASVGGFFILRAKPKGPTGTELERLSGRWECTFRDGAGRVYMHKVKEVYGTTETATWYRPDGTAYRVNKVEFELIVRGNTKLFRYFNGTVADENGMIQPFPPGEYAYTLEGDTWTEFDQTGKAIIVWTRSR